VGVSSWGFEEPSTGPPAGASCPWFAVIRTFYSSLRISHVDDRRHASNIGQHREHEGGGLARDRLDDADDVAPHRLSSMEAICFGVGVLYLACDIVDGNEYLGCVATDESLMAAELLRLRTTCMDRRLSLCWRALRSFRDGLISSWL
jgi:hypothetical protein